MTVISSVLGDESPPDNWEFKSLAELAHPDGLFVDGDWVESRDQDPDGDVRLIQLADIGDGTYRDRSNRFLTSHKAQGLGCTFLQAGDLLIARMPDPLGRACIFPGDAKPSVTVVDVCVVRTKRADHRWLMYAINSPQFRNAVEKLESGTTRKRISRKNLAKLRLPIPPAREQDRIVGRIEELLSELDAGVAALERVRAGLRRYKAAVLRASVTGRLLAGNQDLVASELPEGWRWATVQELARVETGATPLRSNPRYWREGTIPWITSGAINHPTIYEAAEFISEAALVETNAKVFPAGTLLVAMYGEGRTRGKVSELMIEAATNQACAALMFEAKNAEYQPYVKLFFAMNYENIRSQSSGGVQPNLNLSMIKQTRLPLPPVAQQQQIVAEVERRHSIVAEVENVTDAGLMRAARLRQAVLKAAFEGRL